MRKINSNNKQNYKLRRCRGFVSLPLQVSTGWAGVGGMFHVGSLSNRQVLLSCTHTRSSTYDTPEIPRGKRWSSGKGWRDWRKSGSASRWKRRHPAREILVEFWSSAVKSLILTTLREPLRYRFLLKRTGARLLLAIEARLFRSIMVTKYFCMTLSRR